MSARWQFPLVVSLLGIAFAGGPYANRARAQCRHGGGANSQQTPGLMQQQLMQQQLMQQRMLMQQIQRQQLMQTVQLDRQMREMVRQGPEAIKDALHGSSAEKRALAALVVGKYGPALTDDLIQLLTDDQAFVRQAARRGLVQLNTSTVTRDGKPVSGRSVDFGPAPQANRAAQKAAARKWSLWFERQQTRLAKTKAASPPAAATPPLKGIAAAAAKPAP